MGKFGYTLVVVFAVGVWSCGGGGSHTGGNPVSDTVEEDFLIPDSSVDTRDTFVDDRSCQCDPVERPDIDTRCQILQCDSTSCQWQVKNLDDGTICTMTNGNRGQCINGSCGQCNNDNTCDANAGENCSTCPSDCGCPNGQKCHNNKCCTPKTCKDLGWECGNGGDGCGGTLKCGTCGGGKYCSGHICKVSTTIIPKGSFGFDVMSLMLLNYTAEKWREPIVRQYANIGSSYIRFMAYYIGQQDWKPDKWFAPWPMTNGKVDFRKIAPKWKNELTKVLQLLKKYNQVPVVSLFDGCHWTEHALSLIHI